MRALASEYVEAGQLLVKQRRYLSRNIHVTRRKHFKYYPGENVRVRWTTSLAAMVAGRVKYTHDVHRDVIYVNVLPEPREELLRTEIWRYRSEHIRDTLHNKELCLLRSKGLPHFPRSLVNPPVGAKPDKDRVGGRLAAWNNPVIRDPVEIEPYPFALKGKLLKKHLSGELNVVDEGYQKQKSDVAQH
jgi:ribosomal protein L27